MDIRSTLRPGDRSARKQVERFGKKKALGSIWRPHHKVWELPWGVDRGLEIEHRVVATQQGSI